MRLDVTPTQLALRNEGLVWVLLLGLQVFKPQLLTGLSENVCLRYTADWTVEMFAPPGNETLDAEGMATLQTSKLFRVYLKAYRTGLLHHSPAYTPFLPTLNLRNMLIYSWRYSSDWLTVFVYKLVIRS